ncbi:hypothetical protein QO198_18550 [Pseudoalteromonas distincta]|uniref:hypothetical protein n=1 Tax=Pseudoalteromonas distincta TaxID=77608 RepID=UPI00352D8BD8
MRLLILLLALLSAFFVPSVYALPDLSDLKPPQGEHETCIAAYSYQACGRNLAEASMNACDAYGSASLPASTSSRQYTGHECFTDGSNPLPKLRYYGKSYCQFCEGGWDAEGVISYQSINWSNPEEVVKYHCPPDLSPEYDQSIPSSQHPSGTMCAKLLTDEPEEPDPDCPAPTESDPFSFAVGGSGSVCFPAPDGRQCEIQTDSNGGYNIPVSYGSTEPVSCVPDPDPEPEPEPEDPDEPENPDDPEPTPDPDAPKDPDDADDTDKDNSLDGINQINDNLKVINDNMNAGIESHAERLDRMAKETQNSNELLATIKSNTLNTYKGTKETTDVIRDQIKETTKVVTSVGTATTEIKKGNTEKTKQTTLLEGIKENTKKEAISITSSRKKGGLNDIFSADDLAQVTAEIETKKTELTEYIETIKSESESILDLDPNISGSYTDHKEIIKGVEVDLGIGRFSNFYQMIAPAIILIASISALFIILGGNKE